MNLADTADIVFRDIPAPGGDGIPLLNCDFHIWSMMKQDIEFILAVLFLGGWYSS